MPSPSSLRDATSPKVRGLGSPPSFRFIFYALLPQGEPSGAALRLHAFAKGSHFGGAGAKRLRGRGCGQEAAHLVWHCLAEAQLHRKHNLNLGPAPPLPGSPSPSSLRDATSPKVRGLGSPPSFRFIFYALLPQGEPSGAALRLHAFAKGSHFGGAGAKRLRGRGCGQEAAHLVWHCLAEAQLHRKHNLNLGPAPPLPGSPSPSSLRDATSPKVRGLGSPPSFPVYTLRPAAARGAEGVTRRLSAFAKGSPFGGAGKAVRL